MNNLILIALVVGVGYYLLIHQAEPAIKQPFTNSQATQTEPISTDNQVLEKTVDILLQNIRHLNHQIK
ncbi:MAG: hypothetical protein GBAus27B_000305 [Mycoplasmataceae bacterium]|nr:MAG: hypothetical protein GBAus27B_000305 [Mycoplasmataceae bacterium]